MSLVIVSTMCTGRRMLRDLLAIARVMACLIHQVAYVLNLKPRRESNFSTALMSPRLPSLHHVEHGTCHGPSRDRDDEAKVRPR